jgi:hypothetical protein
MNVYNPGRKTLLFIEKPKVSLREDFRQRGGGLKNTYVNNFFYFYVKILIEGTY